MTLTAPSPYNSCYFGCAVAMSGDRLAVGEYRRNTSQNIAGRVYLYKINPDGGFKHFGNVNGDFIIVKGSVPGTYRRLIKLRKQIRNEPKKVVKPNVLEVVI